MFIVFVFGPIIFFICLLGLLISSFYILYSTVFRWLFISGGPMTDAELTNILCAVAVDVACLGLYAGSKIYYKLLTLEDEEREQKK